MRSEERVIVALDRPTTDQNVRVVEALAGRARWFKVGMRQYYAGAQPVFDAIAAAGGSVFLDLKLHDIPATVAGAMVALSPLAPSLITVHASGGVQMVRAAVRALAQHAPNARVLAVTILTSMDLEDLRAVGGDDAQMLPTVLRLARRSIEAGAHGVVASPLEAESLRAALGDALIVTPGVRPPGADHQDQQRVMSPDQALKAGADYLVIGRPIHEATDPLAAFEAIVESIV